MEDSHVLPIQELLFLLYRQRQPWSLNLASGYGGGCPFRIPYPGPPTRLCCVHGPAQGLLGGDWDWDEIARRRGLAPDFLSGRRLLTSASPRPTPQRPRLIHALRGRPRPQSPEARTAAVGPVPTGRLLQAEMPQTWTLQDSIPARVPLAAHSSQSDTRVSCSRTFRTPGDCPAKGSLGPLNLFCPIRAMEPPGAGLTSNSNSSRTQSSHHLPGDCQC